MSKKSKYVNVRVHEHFFDGWFEPTRIKYEKKMGIPLSQVKFTGIIADKWKLKRRKTFIPKEFRKYKFYA